MEYPGEGFSVVRMGVRVRGRVELEYLERWERG